MNKELCSFATRLRGWISPGTALKQPLKDDVFDSLALELFALQYQHNHAYRKICDSRQLTPATVRFWGQAPFVPTGAFKELELTSIPAMAQMAVFHSSGTTEQKPSRHFHCAESLALYEASAWQWFCAHFNTETDFVFLTPDGNGAPRSSLVHMFETVRSNVKCAEFLGNTGGDGAWTLDFKTVLEKLEAASRAQKSLTILGTAFSFVHLLDFLAEMNLRFALPPGSCVMETGGYKNRSRVMPKSELHALVSQYLGVSRDSIICEYGMSELSSQAYSVQRRSPTRLVSGPHQRAVPKAGAPFHFPPWARARIISPETGHEVADGETGIIRVFDLANVFSVAAIQTEDLGVRRGDGFELIGRAQPAEPRGCSLMTA